MKEYIVPNRKRLPYGMMNFADIRCENYYYEMPSFTLRVHPARALSSWRGLTVVDCFSSYNDLIFYQHHSSVFVVYSIDFTNVFIFRDFPN